MNENPSAGERQMMRALADLRAARRVVDGRAGDLDQANADLDRALAAAFEAGAEWESVALTGGVSKQTAQRRARPHRRKMEAGGRPPPSSSAATQLGGVR